MTIAAAPAAVVMVAIAAASTKGRRWRVAAAVARVLGAPMKSLPEKRRSTAAAGAVRQS